MGDRANIKIGSKEVGWVYFYTHWSGEELPVIAQRALIRGQNRWGDTAYLGRIVFCEMVKGEEMSETGYGISAKVGDGEDRVLVIDDSTSSVYRERSTKQRSFAEFCKMKNPSWENL